MSPYPAMLHEQAYARRWEDATRLCRFVKDVSLWSALAVLAAEARNLTTLETCYAAIDQVRANILIFPSGFHDSCCHVAQVDKVEYIQSIKDIPSTEGRNAALALFCHQVCVF